VVPVGSLVLFLGLTLSDQKAPPVQSPAQKPDSKIEQQTGQKALAAASPLMRARDAYNAGRYDEAIRFASDARTEPESADAAAVVFARAHLERYRTALAEDDLTSARDALKGVTTARLTSHDYGEYLVGLGESLYYEERFGAAAECFSLALTRGDEPAPAVRDRLFDWWAGSLDQQAQIGPEADRKSTYQRIVDRAEVEVVQHDHSAAAAYWLAAASRGADDLERAWAATIAGWVRAPATGERGPALRADLDRLMTLAIIPERARRLLPSGDLQPVVQRLMGEWLDVKTKWGIDR
jgi:tetratricopeptide (TPR) repeat protein